MAADAEVLAPSQPWTVIQDQPPIAWPAGHSITLADARTRVPAGVHALRCIEVEDGGHLDWSFWSASLRQLAVLPIADTCRVGSLVNQGYMPHVSLLWSSEMTGHQFNGNKAFSL
jgi:hypothetical protein